MTLQAKPNSPNNELHSTSLQDSSLSLERPQFLAAKEKDIEFLVQKPARLSLVAQLIDYAESADFARKFGQNPTIEKAHFIRIMGSVVLGLSVSEKDNSSSGEFSYVAKFNNPEFSKDLERFGNAQQRFAKAAWISKKLEDNGLEMPSIIAIGESNVGDQTLNWMVQQKTRGLEGKNLDLIDQNSDKLWAAVGRAITEVNRIEPNGYGHRFNSETNSFEQSWTEFITEELNKINLANVLKECKITGSSIGSITERLKLLETLVERYPVAINHLDLNPNHNIFFDPTTIDSNLVKTCGIIDFDSSAALPGAVFEVACQLNGAQLSNGNKHGVNRLIEAMGLDHSSHLKTFWRDVEAVQVLLSLQTATFALSAPINDYTRPQIESISKFLQGSALVP